MFEHNINGFFGTAEKQDSGFKLYFFTVFPFLKDEAL